ncbi:paraquat-inducible protein A [Mannheimia massilioguelmaensis]|uniref:paraquat-inducible protein A n=1 Tax=Mannheimia massilioguelmaensis TaxID=1604354 RepID=UPI0005C9F5BE|nr:paraquat-inducible protein A [Mannheimia massilioguelmaensis]
MTAFAQPSQNEKIVRCRDCNALVSMSDLDKYQNAECPRCHNQLGTTDRWSLRRCSIIAISILILMPFALTYPLLSVDLLGTKVDASIWGGVWKMAIEGYPYTAFLVFICAVFMPIAFALLVITLQVAKLAHKKPRILLLVLGYIKPWVMFDVYLIALGVTAFKVRDYASIEINIYLIGFLLTSLMTTLLFVKINVKALWHEFYPSLPPLTKISDKNPPHLCGSCEYTFEHYMIDRKNHPICPRCHSPMDIPEHLNLQKTWATLIAGIIMLFPANILPISYTSMNNVATGDTLMSGVISFLGMGSYFVAFVVFFASIFVPISKVFIMIYLLLCVHYQWKHSIKWQMRLFHIVHFVGRWSMLDLFVLSLMMSLVTRGQIINFSVGPAAFYFGSAVFLTMLSTTFFDSRLLWNIYDKQHAKP